MFEEVCFWSRPSFTRSRCRKPTRSGPTRSSCTWLSFRSSEARCPRWWPVPKPERGPTPSPRTRSPTRDCTGTMFERRRDTNAPSGRASNAPFGRVTNDTLRLDGELWMELWDLNENLRNRRHPRTTDKPRKQETHTCAGLVSSEILPKTTKKNEIKYVSEKCTAFDSFINEFSGFQNCRVDRFWCLGSVLLIQTEVWIIAVIHEVWKVTWMEKTKPRTLSFVHSFYFGGLQKL